MGKKFQFCSFIICVHNDFENFTEMGGALAVGGMI
jgi:hypothetical protein